MWGGITAYQREIEDAVKVLGLVDELVACNEEVGEMVEDPGELKAQLSWLLGATPGREGK